jgi:hypothetical protein
MLKKMSVALALTLAFTGAVEAKSKKRSDFTKAQQAKFFEEGMKVCRKKYGPEATVYKVDYLHWRYLCLAR